MAKRDSDFCDGISRRALLQAGLGGLVGLSLPELLRLRIQAAETTPTTATPETAVIYLEMAGGPTQHETYDPKPASPREYRGPFSAVSTAIAGVQFSELMVEQARIADKLIVMRAVSHDSSSHPTSSHLTQTGYYLRNRTNRDNEMPCFGSIAARVRGPVAKGVPAFVSVPGEMRYGRASWLGKGYNAFSTDGDANRRKFKVPNLTLIDGIDVQRLNERRTLLSEFDAARRTIDNDGVAEAMDQFTRQAFEMVTNDAARRAFDLANEPEKVRRRYGNNALGQNVLLARRLVESGITVVTVRMNSLGSWDDHGGIAKSMNRKGPGFDRAIAALVEDLYERGLEKRVLVVAMGEFGRTPRVNRNAGRDHWGNVMSVLLAGGGVPAGQIIGSTDKTGSTPMTARYRPQNILAHIYRHLGINAAQTFVDLSGRPRYVLEERSLIRELA